MRILGIDTATRATSAALCDFERGDLALEGRDDPPFGQRPRHATRLMALIIGVLEQAGVGWEEIDRIAVGVGPGTFTGLRIGIATARALSRAREIPLVGVSTLQSLALNAQIARVEADTVLAVLDARRGEVFAAAWRAAGSARPGQSTLARSALPAQALAPVDLVARLPDLGPRTLALGDGAIEFRSVLERAGALVPEGDSELHRVTAINHCRLAVGQRGNAPDDIRPQYLRLPDAEIARRIAGSL